MKINTFANTIFIGLLALMFMGCQNQTDSNAANQTDSNLPANNSNLANQTASEIPAPQEIKFTSAGDVEIIGTFYQSPKANSPAVLLLHQFGSSRQSFDEFAKIMQKKNLGVLAIDGRGFGDSTKTTGGETVAAERTDEAVNGMRADVKNAFEFLANQKNVDANRMGIVGASYGSSLALIDAAENKQVKAVALLSPGINYFGNLPTEPALKNYGDRPLLMVAAEDDEESADAVRKLKAENPNEKYETQIYEKGGHGTNIFDADAGLQDVLEQFLVKNL